ncbi:50S ribosomal protein L13 [Candidatus Peregrinibacteria bacterium CG10_big_fil_rev_8_21_14_0_10_49_16]|nr:MAG: 50S ribosomal protein L13 [Candidatus Peregrinibacteria bacterium CG22_combo_CG10-13_8_21_14_all_49_11]PIR51853.1 MAG: 50S ribosomal protein L13 [Candidatus Peregrinibacteria bacterium CG10_big_fil_rev_8_21_14_0_10_49_16]
MKTSTPKPPAPHWLLIDAEGQSLGRLSAQIASLLRGKCWEGFAPHHVCGPHVIVLNVGKLAFAEKKWHRKTYYKHTGYLGNLRSKTLREAFDKSPAWVIEHAVKGMLPANRLRPAMLKRLHVCTGTEHKYDAQKPQKVTLKGKGLFSVEPSSSV